MSKKPIFELLTKRYPPNEYALLAEVRDAAGFNASRSADYVAINLWPSRGLAVNGIELKSFRSDWLSEKKKPEKAESIFKYCDYFWLLTTDDTIAKMEEIPDSWGWLCVKGESIRVMKDAPKLQASPISRNFLCALLKRACDRSEFIPRDLIEDKLEERYKQGMEVQKRSIDIATKSLTELQGKVDAFQKHSGIDFDFRWGYEKPEKIGAAVKLLMNGGAEQNRQALINLEINAKTIHERIKKEIEILSQTKP